MAYNYYESPEVTRRYYTPTATPKPSMPRMQQAASPSGWQNDPAPSWLKTAGNAAEKATNFLQMLAPGTETLRKGLTSQEQQSGSERFKNIALGLPTATASVATGATKLLAPLGVIKGTGAAVGTNVVAQGAENTYGGNITGPTTVDRQYGAYTGTQIPSTQVAQLANFIQTNPEDGALAAQKMYRQGLISKSVYDKAVQASIDAVNNRLAASQAAEAAQKKRDSDFMKAVQGLGKAEYGAASGQASSAFNIGKEQAQNELTKLITLLGQRNAGGAADLGGTMAQAGYSTSPGLYDVGLDILNEERILGEQQGKEGFAQTVAQLGQQRAAAQAAAAAARRAAQLQAIANYTGAQYPGTVGGA